MSSNLLLSSLLAVPPVNRLRILRTSSLEKDVFDGIPSEGITPIPLDLTPDSQVEKFEWAEVLRAFLDPQVWLMGLATTAISIPVLALGFYLYVAVLPDFSHRVVSLRFTIQYPLVSPFFTRCNH